MAHCKFYVYGGGIRQQFALRVVHSIYLVPTYSLDFSLNSILFSLGGWWWAMEMIESICLWLMSVTTNFSGWPYGSQLVVRNVGQTLIKYNIKELYK